MQVILLDKVVNLGNLGEIVKVKDGYARNFLIPQGRARRATEANKAEFEAKRAELEKAAGAKLVLVGDDAQLPEIAAGGGFRALAQTLGPIELSENRRQIEAGLPQVTLAVEHYNRMVRLIDAKVPVTVELNVDVKFHPESLDHLRLSAIPPAPGRGILGVTIADGKGDGAWQPRYRYQ